MPEVQAPQGSPQNETLLEGYITIRKVADLLGKTELTIHTWTQPPNDLPYVRIPGDRRDTIRFKYDDVISWAQRTGRRVRLLKDGQGD